MNKFWEQVRRWLDMGKAEEHALIAIRLTQARKQAVEARLMMAGAIESTETITRKLDQLEVVAICGAMLDGQKEFRPLIDKINRIERSLG